MRWFLTGLFVTFLGLQYQLWFSSTGIIQIHHLKRQIAQLKATTSQLKAENELVKKKIKRLKSFKGSVETIARYHYGFIGSGEMFYRIVIDDAS